ncbi:unnamed protein product [Ceutorhynchus assimilis]|uniref:Ig-like domain-containing protein n=1 Tax=Ceutorhynchus assimilis TaxID=467358 RepID=A0A9N9QRS3_9CUCU|nr:unnamed protein product [Ceutorhynchus assimilis]
MSKTEKNEILVLKRKSCLARIEEIFDYANNKTADQFYQQNLAARLEYLDTLYEEFQELQNSIISLISDRDFDTHDLEPHVAVTIPIAYDLVDVRDHIEAHEDDEVLSQATDPSLTDPEVLTSGRPETLDPASGFARKQSVPHSVLKNSQDPAPNTSSRNRIDTQLRHSSILRSGNDLISFHNDNPFQPQRPSNGNLEFNRLTPVRHNFNNASPSQQVQSESQPRSDQVSNFYPMDNRPSQSLSEAQTLAFSRQVGSEPITEILGSPEMYINMGSTINLTCIVQYAPEPPPTIVWAHNSHVINFDSPRGGISLVTEKEIQTKVKINDPN